MFEKEAEEWVKKEFPLLDVEHINLEESITEYRAYKDGAEFGYNKANEELKEKISVLLSCKNCSENKGGWICAKEYENKCLTQKIVFIQELKKENARLKLITYKGKTQHLAEWCRELNLKYSKIQARLNESHWSVERAFEE